MPRTVYKYPVTLDSHQRIDLAPDARIVHFGAQGDRLYVWVETDPNARHLYPLYLTVVGTGGTVPQGGRHLGTTQVGPVVWHLYTDPT